MYQISALIFLTVLTWAIAIWATLDSDHEREESLEIDQTQVEFKKVA